MTVERVPDNFPPLSKANFQPWQGGVCAILHEYRLAEVGVAKTDDSNWGRAAGLGLQVCVGVVLGVVVGQWLDRRYGWSSTGTIVGAMLGLAAGMYLLIKEALKMNK